MGHQMVVWQLCLNQGVGEHTSSPTIYQDDPTLPVGTMKQVDWAAAGAKASFDYKVVRNGETLQEKTFSTHTDHGQVYF